MIDVKIGSIAEFINGVAFKPEDWSVDGKKIIRIQNLTDSSKEYNRTQREVHSKYNIQKGDVLVSWSATIDVFIWNNEDAWLNQHIFKVNFDTNKVFKNYFVYALKNTINELNKLAHGATMRHIIKSDFENHKIPLPSYENQIKIANLLERIETLIAERQNTIDLLDELVKATFYEMFGDPVKNEKGWDKDILNNIVAEKCSISYGVVQPGEEFHNGIAVVRPVDLSNTFITKKGLKLIDPVIANKFKRTILNGNEILFCVRGTTGLVSIATEELKGANVTRGIVPLFFNERVNLIFIFFLIKTEQFQKIISDNTYGSALKQINLSTLRELSFIIPSLNLQNKFATIAQKIETIKAEQEAQKKVMEELYASITQKVFNDEDFDLSRVPFDASLVPKEEDIVVIEKEVKQQIKLPKEKEKNTKTENYKREEINSKLKGLSWDNISFEYVANAIKSHFHQVYFNAEMLLRYLTEDLGIQVNYFSSAEQKQNQQLENADDFYSFISSAVTGTNAYIQFEQVFYNAVEENIKDIRFKEEDLESILQKISRSGVYFRIKETAF